MNRVPRPSQKVAQRQHMRCSTAGSPSPVVGVSVGAFLTSNPTNSGLSARLARVRKAQDLAIQQVEVERCIAGRSPVVRVELDLGGVAQRHLAVAPGTPTAVARRKRVP